MQKYVLIALILLGTVRCACAQDVAMLFYVNGKVDVRGGARCRVSSPATRSDAAQAPRPES